MGKHGVQGCPGNMLPGVWVCMGYLGLSVWWTMLPECWWKSCLPGCVSSCKQSWLQPLLKGKGVNGQLVATALSGHLCSQENGKSWRPGHGVGEHRASPARQEMNMQTAEPNQLGLGLCSCL